MRAVRRVILLVAFTLLSPVVLDAEELTLDQLIDRNVQAVGGRAAIEAVHSIRFDLHIVDPDFEAGGVYYAARPGRMRIDITAGGKRVYTEALGEKRGWQWKGKGEPVEESETATGALRHGVELPDKLFGLYEVRQRGNKLELVGREMIEKVNYHVLRLTFSDGVAMTLYIDPESWLITRRREIRALHPDIDPTPTTIETTMSDFRKVDGLRFAFATVDTDLTTGKVLEKATVGSIVLNPPLEPAFFENLETSPTVSSSAPAKKKLTRARPFTQLPGRVRPSYQGCAKKGEWVGDNRTSKVARTKYHFRAKAQAGSSGSFCCCQQVTPTARGPLLSAFPSG